MGTYYRAIHRERREFVDGNLFNLSIKSERFASELARQAWPDGGWEVVTDARDEFWDVVEDGFAPMRLEQAAVNAAAWRAFPDSAWRIES